MSETIGSGFDAEHINLQEVTKRYGQPPRGTLALTDINLTIHREELLVFLGPSGCGKSTLLKMVAGLIPTTDGQINVSGQPLQDKRGTDRSRLGELGMVFQSPNLFPWFTIEENIALPLRLRGVDKRTRRDKAAQLCELLGLSGFEHNWPRELSGGMQQRAAIARALSYQPEILLADEPFGALDALTRDQLNLELQRVQAETSCTVVFVTHSISEAVFLADRVILLSPRPGTIDTTVEIDFERPRALEVQSTPEFQRIVTELRHRLDDFSTQV